MRLNIISPDHFFIFVLQKYSIYYITVFLEVLGVVTGWNVCLLSMSFGNYKTIIRHIISKNVSIVHACTPKLQCGAMYALKCNNCTSRRKTADTTLMMSNTHATLNHEGG